MITPRRKSIRKTPGSNADTELSTSEVKKRAVRGVSSLYVRQLMIRILGFVGMLVLARILTPEIFGIFAIAGFVISFLEEISRLGLSAALIRKKESVTPEELTTAFTLQITMTVALLIVLYVAAPLITEHYKMDDSMVWLFRVMSLSFLLTAFKAMPAIRLQRSLRHDLLAVSEVFEYIIYQIIAISLALAGLEVWALVAATLARSISGVSIINYLAWWKPRLGINRKAAKKILAFGIPIQLSSFASLANNAIVPVLIGTFLGTASVGYVNFASKSMNSVAWQPLILLGKVQLRVFSTIQDETEKLRRVLEMTLFIGSSITFLLASIFLSLAEPLINVVIGEKWLPALPVIYLTTGGYITLAILTPYVQVLKALGDSITPMLFSYMLLIIQTFLIVMLVNKLHIISYAIAFSVGYLVAAPYVIRKTHQYVKPALLSNILPPLICAVLAGILAHLASKTIGGLHGMAAAILVNTLVFVTLLAVLRGDQLCLRLLDVIQSIKPAILENENSTVSRICWLLKNMQYRNYFKLPGETGS